MSRRLLPLLAAVARVSAGLSLVCVAGAHLHLCFDGLEAPVTLHHLADGGDHLDHHSPERGHSDADVELDTSLTGAPKSGADGPAISFRVESAAAGVRSTSFLHPVDAPSSRRTSPRSYLPPLRAPPTEPPFLT